MQAEIIKKIDSNYKNFFNTIDEFLFVLDAKGDIIDVNDTVIERLGYKIDELIGLSVLMIHPADRRKEASKIVQEMLEGSSKFCPVPIITKGGVQIPVETRITKGLWGGKPALFGVTKDISQLRISEEKFSKIFSLNPSPCGLSSLVDHKFIEVNDAFYTFFGFKKGEVIGKTPFELKIFTEEVANSVVKKQDKNGRIINASAKLISKSGEIKHVLLSAEDINVQDQKYRFTFVTDVTDMLNLTEEFKERDKLLTGLTRATDCMLSDQTLTTKNIIDALQSLGEATLVDRVYIFEHKSGMKGERGSMSQRYEWSRKNVEPQIDNPKLQNVLWDDAAPRWYDSLIKGKHISGDVVDFPPIERAALEPQEIQSLLVLPIEVSHKFWGFIGFDSCIDKRAWSESEAELLKSVAKSFAVTIERMKAERNLVDSKQRMENILRGTNAGTWEWNVQTGEVVFNERWAEMLGYTLKELSPISISTWNNLAHPKDLIESGRLLNEHFADRSEYYKFECRMKHKNGKWVWIYDTGRIITRTSDGKPLMMFGTHSDITEKKELEQKMLEQIEQTEKMNKYMLGRELKMIELKNEIEALKRKGAI